MAQMSPTVGTVFLGSGHADLVIHPKGDMALDFAVKTWPARPGIKFVLAAEQGMSTAPADIGALFLDFQECTAEGPLGGLLAQYGIFQVPQLGPPLGIGLHDIIGRWGPVLGAFATFL